jgi:transposase
MTTEVDYAQTQTYLQHFRDQGCDRQIVANTEGLFNLCWFSVSMIDELKQALEKKTVNIDRLKEIIFGVGKNPETAAGDDQTPPASNDPAEPPPEEDSKKEKKKAKGHGRHGIDAYTGAQVVVCTCTDWHAGDVCPQCAQGILQLKTPVFKLQIDGHAPLAATRYELERIACSLCPFEVIAPAPVDLTHKCTEKPKATLVHLHYGMGLPYYRLAKMQDMLGVPIAVSTQSELVASIMGPVHPVFNYLVFYAAQSDWLFQDDTGVKIQSLIQENKHNPARKGMYTSGFVAQAAHQVVLFFSGRAHAGENFDQLIAHRDPDKGLINRMADALSANSKHKALANESKCNAHAFRRFRSLLSTYPEQAQFVLHIYGQIYDHDDYCKDHDYDDQQRLVHHQTVSQPLMDELKAWVEVTLTQVEPNGVLATECQYLINHWSGLTQFLHIPGAPLDNNLIEALLKTIILYRKNSQSFKTQYSAEYGSRLISVIVTCLINGIDAIDYLTQLQRYESAVWRDPAAWAPWCYQQTLREMSNDPIGAQQAA